MVFTLNFLNILKILIAIVYQIIFLQFFGAGLETDVYLIVLGVIQYLAILLVSTIADIYVPFYSQLKNEDSDRADQLVGSVLIFFTLLMSSVCVLLYFFSFSAVKIFSLGFTEEKALLAAQMMEIWSVALFFNVMYNIVNQILVANLYLKIHYQLSLITPIANFIALIFFSATWGIYALVYSFLLGTVVNFVIIYLYFMRCSRFQWKNPFYNSDLRQLFRQSLPFYVGKYIYHSETLIVSNLLSFFPTGHITLFHYAQRLFKYIASVSNSPTLSVLYAKASQMIAEDKRRELGNLLAITLKTNMVLFVLLTMGNVWIFKPLYSLAFGEKVSTQQLDVLYYLFIILVPYNVVWAIQLPFAKITFALKKGSNFLFISLWYICIFAISICIFMPTLGVYGLPLAMFVSQIFSAKSYMKITYEYLQSGKMLKYTTSVLYLFIYIIGQKLLTLWGASLFTTACFLVLCCLFMLRHILDAGNYLLTKTVN
ncbi:lipid II flippase MurJ [Candidatus Uabimicrobium amorphum]|uniref:Putative lipid II flippase MurJ n=1 Tax=Uabimicrobium amorphum TaxID=2596890 RepID=A0A5S9F1S4_UABAM|nr:lipid II flippase MurJ [Candidatus Uabimicrobium amorphum]BBM82501.1 putative lipid II flippase MurJ [Candidatus Uabimicrobium amorphum]